MKVLVTGASGFVGSNIVDKLIDLDHDVYSLFRESSSKKYLNPKSHLVHGSLEDLSNVDDIKNEIDVVIHVAGLVASKNKKDLHRVNVEGTKNLINLFSNSLSIGHFIYVSSQTASGPTKTNEIKDETFSDSPITQYGRSKLTAEKVIINSSLPYTILRPTAIFGPRDKAMLDLIKLAYQGYHIQIGKNKKISLCYINDLVDLISELIDKKPTFDKFFIASYPAITFEYFNRIIHELSKKKYFALSLPESMVKLLGFINEYVSKYVGLTSVFDRDKAKDLTASSWEISFNKAIKELNYKPVGNLKADLINTLKYSEIINDQ